MFIYRKKGFLNKLLWTPSTFRYLPFTRKNYKLNFQQLHEDLTELAQQYGDIYIIYIDS